MFVVVHLPKGSTDFYDFFCEYLVGMRIGSKVHFISLGDVRCPYPDFFYLLCFFRFGIKIPITPNFHPPTPPLFLIAILVFVTIIIIIVYDNVIKHIRMGKTWPSIYISCRGVCGCCTPPK